MNIALIEDEPLMLEALEEALLELDNNINVVARLRSVKQASNFFKNNPSLDLIFSDIKLGDGSSFNIFEKHRPSAPVVFCTAFDSYALQAFKANGLHYILKPFELADIKEALDKFHRLTQANKTQEVDWHKMLKAISNQPSDKPTQQTLLVHQGEQIIPLSINDIALVSFDAGIVYLHTFSKKRYPTSHTLDGLGKTFGNAFYRLNRQHLINRGAIEKVNQYFARKLKVDISIEYTEPLIVSKANASAFLSWLEQA